jgi:elongation factor Ts
MPKFTAQDVKSLREQTGAGMLDCRNALEATDGDLHKAAQWLREHGLGQAAERAGRDNPEGAIAVATAGDTAALVELKAESDFVAKSPQFVAVVEELAKAVAAGGESEIDARKPAVEDLRITLKENIQVGRLYRFEAGPGHVLGTYLHVQNGRGVNGVLVELEGGDAELAHDLAVHIAFGRPAHRIREEVPEAEVDAERQSLEAQTRHEGKPEQAIPKIVEGRLSAWYKRAPGGVLLEQPFVRDDKRTVAQVLGPAKVVRFAQVVVGA